MSHSSDPTTWPLFLFESLDSTNDEARRIAANGEVVPPFVVRGRTQTNGRGRGENTWWSDEGSLLFTLVFDPRPIGISLRHEPRLALVAALAVIDSMPSINLMIRWPNDVVAGLRKICGVLTEKIDTPDHRSLICLGVGVNVNTSVERAPPEVARLATSAKLLGLNTTIEAVLADFLRHFQMNMLMLANDDRQQVDRWNGLNSLVDRHIKIRQGRRIIAGIAEAIDAEGALVLKTSTGSETIHGGQLIHD